MSNFENYAIYYNLLYRDKDYDRESVFVLNLLEKYGEKPKTLLDLGCGTGRHALALAHKGIRITGVDISEQMLEMGRLEEGAAKNLNIPPELIYGDARTVRLGKTLSACVSLFHVLSYQVTEKDCCAMLRTAWEHLEPGGLFMFDFWYGPGVLHLRPENRELVRETPENRLVRKATPVMDTMRDLVNVHYEMLLENQKTGEITSFTEDHLMRYWFLPELRYLSEQVGFEYVASGAWLKESAPTEDDWAAWMVVRKRKNS